MKINNISKINSNFISKHVTSLLDPMSLGVGMDGWPRD
jgi:hypothetical protein